MTTNRRPQVVVIGAGSGGVVVAARLAASKAFDVTMIEAGPVTAAHETPPLLSGPDFLAAAELPGRHWDGLSVTLVEGGTPRPYRRGRGLGGSSSINAMVALPGVPADYDEWAGRYGCAGWAWHDVEPWFSRTALTLRLPAADEIGEVARALGEFVPSARDGVLLTRDAEGRRVAVDNAYLVGGDLAGRLTLVGDTLVDRVAFRGTRAVGVVAADGRSWDADLVVLAAGAIHSPAILLRSGVDVAGIGSGLQDHPSFPITFRRRRPASPDAPIITTVARLEGFEGPDDLQLLPMEHVGGAALTTAVVMGALMRVHSRGSVRLRSPDPSVDPLVEFDMLSDERDVRGLELARDRVLEFARTDAALDVMDVVDVDRSVTALCRGVGDYVHAVGTCAMGTVVDTRCRLRGHTGIVVADASVMPQIPRANTHLPTVMIGERVAAMLIDENAAGLST